MMTTRLMVNEDNGMVLTNQSLKKGDLTKKKKYYLSIKRIFFSGYRFIYWIYISFLLFYRKYCSNFHPCWCGSLIIGDRYEKTKERLTLILDVVCQDVNEFTHFFEHPIMLEQCID